MLHILYNILFLLTEVSFIVGLLYLGYLIMSLIILFMRIFDDRSDVFHDDVFK